MGPQTPRHPNATGALTPARARILEWLQHQTAAVRAEDAAAVFGQHINTVRGHLDQLVAQDLAVRSREPGPGPGRPSWRYRAHPEHREADPRVREYGALAAALARHVARTSANPVDDSFTAGVEWGRELAAASTHRTGSGASARRGVVEILDDLGFAPVTSSRATSVRLTRCPLLDVAERYPDIVCNVHRGLVAGALEQLGDRPHAVALLPFAEPDACLLHLDPGTVPS
ncbi:MAG: transcriptional regulator [Actinomycetales bacterium]|nr:transcriptional regulator [Actinomycetales bacterium]